MCMVVEFKEVVMNGLIEAFGIFLKYGNPKKPLDCNRDMLTILDIDPSIVSVSDHTRLEELGFFVDEKKRYKTKGIYTWL